MLHNNIINGNQVPSTGDVNGKPAGYGGGKCHCANGIEDWVCEHFEEIGKLMDINFAQDP
jgi:hypothetical protein